MLYHAKTFLEKLANFNFTFLFVSKNYLGWKWSSRDIWLHNFGPNWSQITHLRKRGGLGENWLMLLLGTYCALPCSNVSKSPYSRLWDKVGQFWAKLGQNCSFSAKGNFSEKLTNVNFFHFVFLFQKDTLGGSWSKRLHKFGKNWPQVVHLLQKWLFLGKATSAPILLCHVKMF